MMEIPTLEFNQKRWNRLLLNCYWVVLLLTVIVECLYMTVTKVPPTTFLWLFIARPSIFLATVIGLAEVGIRKLPRYHDYILITASTLIAVTLTLVHSTINYLSFSMFFPILVSTFYFQLKKLMFALASALLAVVLLYTLNEELHTSISSVGVVSISTIMIVYSFISLGVLMRGREMVGHLQSTYVSHQELLIRTIVMDKLAKTDALTDLYNHMAFQEYLERLTEQAEKGTLKLHLAIMDIDNFKGVNDTYGHRAGDEVLRKVSGIIRSKVSENDIAARYGGEELAVLFTDMSLKDIFDKVEDIRTSIDSASYDSLGGASISISIGLATYASGIGKEAFFQSADNALYQAKRSGKNQTVIASHQVKMNTSKPSLV